MDGGGHVRLQVDREQVGARLGEGLHKPSRLLHHQMGVQEHAGVLADGLDHRHTDGNVGHKHPVHHVHMDPVGGGDGLDIPPQFTKIGGKNGGSDLDHTASSFHNIK